jgi:hypothetical protein
MPVDEGAIVFVHLGIFYDYGPGTNAGFAPIGISLKCGKGAAKLTSERQT